MANFPTDGLPVSSEWSFSLTRKLTRKLQQATVIRRCPTGCAPRLPRCWPLEPTADPGAERGHAAPTLRQPVRSGVALGQVDLSTWRSTSAPIVPGLILRRVIGSPFDRAWASRECRGNSRVSQWPLSRAPDHVRRPRPN